MTSMFYLAIAINSSYISLIGTIFFVHVESNSLVKNFESPSFTEIYTTHQYSIPVKVKEAHFINIHDLVKTNKQKTNKQKLSF